MMNTSVYDLSGGDSHLREIADESGVEWLAYHSSEENLRIGDFEIEVWYDENASSGWNAWKSFCKGYGSDSGASREEAIERLFCRTIMKSKK